jgi:hypothetical protein
MGQGIPRYRPSYRIVCPSSINRTARYTKLNAILSKIQKIKFSLALKSRRCPAKCKKKKYNIVYVVE